VRLLSVSHRDQPCLNQLRSLRQRPVTAAPLPVAAAEPTRLGEVLLLHPILTAAEGPLGSGARAICPLRVPRGDLAGVRHRRSIFFPRPSARGWLLRIARIAVGDTAEFARAHEDAALQQP